MGRPVSELSSDYRRDLRRAVKRKDAADAELMERIAAGIEASEPHAAIARELGISPALFWTRYRPVRNPGRRQAEGEDA